MGCAQHGIGKWGRAQTMEKIVSTIQFCALFILLLPALFLMSACVSAEQYAGAAEQAAKDAKDIEAGVLEDAPCLIGLGAWSRMDDIRKRRGVFYLCVPDAEQWGVRIGG